MIKNILKKISVPQRPLREGFSLIEVVSFVMIVAISFVVLVLVFRNAGNFSMRGDLLTQASQLAVSRMEEIRSLKFEDLLDEDSVSETIGSITITSSVYYVDPEDDLETSVTGPTSIIRIVVTAASPEIPAISISTLYLDR
jgi:Tfp pilus assembly protein PilV